MSRGVLGPYTTAAVLALTVCVTLLTWHGSVDGQATVGFFTGALGLIGGAAAGAHGVRQGSQATAAPPPDV